MEFEQAVEIVSGIKGLGNEQMLRAYGLFKQATCGDCLKQRPSMFEFRERAKFDAWKALENVSKEDAQRQYIELAQSISSIPAPLQQNGWVSVSTMETSIEYSEDSKSHQIFELAKGGDAALLDSKDLSLQDQNGMTVLHWLADRGHLSLIKEFLKLEQGSAAIDALDNDGNTAMHLAFYAEELEIVNYMINAGANSKILDSDGKCLDDLLHS